MRSGLTHRSLIVVATLFATLLVLSLLGPVVSADTPVFPVFAGYPKQGCYGYVVGSTGMYTGRGLISVDVPGPVVDAWLIWEGVNDTDDPGNPNTTVLEVNGQPVVGQMTDHTVYSTVHADWYQWVADVGPNGYNLISQGTNTLDIFEWWPLGTYKDGSNSMDPRRNGATLIVIYDRSPCSDPVEIVPFYGSDYVWWQGDPRFDGGPLTENHVFVFDPSPENRQAHLVINFAGMGSKVTKAGICRDTAIWAAIGVGAPPAAIVQTGFPGSTGINGGVLVGDNLLNLSPPCTQAYNYPVVAYSGGWVGDEWSTVDLTFDVPAGNEWLAVQLESVSPGVPPVRPGGESGAWASGVFMIPLPPPDLAITKSDGLTTADPGQIITYTLEFENLGLGLAQNVVITDTLPARTTFLGCTTTLGTCSESGGVVTVQVGDLQAGDFGSVDITVQLDPLFPAGTTTLTNTAVITTTTRGDDPANNSAEDTTDVFAFVTLDLQKAGTPEPVDAGTPITYTLTWSVGGNAFADSIVLTDTLPAEVDFSAASDGGTYDAGTHTVTWALGNHVPGDGGTVTLVGNVHTPLPNGIPITNTAHIEDASGATADAVAVNTVRSDHELHIAKDGPAEVDNGSLITYTIAYSVTGNEPAPNVVITDVLPDFASYVSGGDAFDAASRTVTWNLGDIDPPFSGSVSLVARITGRIPDGTVITNTATIGDDDPGTASAQDTAATTVRSAAIEGVVFEDVDGSGTQDAGEGGVTGAEVCVFVQGEATALECVTTGSDGGYRFEGLVPGSYTVKLTSWPSGYVTTTPTSVDLTVPAGGVGQANFGVAQPAAVEGVVFEDANGNGTQDAGEGGVAGADICLYAPGTTSPLDCTTTGSDGGYRFDGLTPGTYTVQLTSWPGGYEPTTPASVSVTAPAGGVGRADFGIARPDFNVAKEFAVPVGAPVKVEVGDLVTFTIRVENTGGVPLSVIPLTDTFDPTFLRFVSASPAPDSAAAGTLTWNDLTGSGDLAPGASITVQVVFEALAETSSTDNTATVSGATSQGGQTLPDKSASVSFSIQPPTAVTMADILAEFDGTGVVLTWITTAEFDNWGFNVYRAEVNDPSMAVRVNEHLIPGRGQSVSGATYHFVDHTVQPGTRYWYWIEDVDLHGNTTWHGPVEVFVPDVLHPGTGGSGTLFLPMIVSR